MGEKLVDAIFAALDEQTVTVPGTTATATTPRIMRATGGVSHAGLATTTP